MSLTTTCEGLLFLRTDPSLLQTLQDLLVHLTSVQLAAAWQPIVAGGLRGYLQGPWLIGVNVCQLGLLLGLVSLPLCCSLLPLPWRRLCEDAVACATHVLNTTLGRGRQASVLHRAEQTALVSLPADDNVTECAQGYQHETGNTT